MKKVIFVGQVPIGGNSPVSVQSMTCTDTRDAAATLKQIFRLARAGCDIVRVAVQDAGVLESFSKITAESELPVIADIHFDAKLAIASIRAGAKGIRINPGNIGSKDKLKAIIDVAAEHEVPVRIGVNAGSLEKKYKHASGNDLAERMVSSALDYVSFFEKQNFFNIKLSLKSSDVLQTIAAYRLVDKKCDYPLHLGVTETGTFFTGTVKSAIGIGSLLADGIGNTIRVSLTDDPVEEVRVAREILKVLGLQKNGINLVSCPTCSRTSVDLISHVKEIEKALAGLRVNRNITVAVMGCEVNGPGEAGDADVGLAFSKKWGYIFRQGKMEEKLLPGAAVKRLIEIAEKMAQTSD